MADEQNWDWGNLGNWDWWTSGKDWLGPNTQYGLAGMAAAIDKGAPTGNVGEMMQRYIQGQAAQKAYKEQMMQYKPLFDALAAQLGVDQGTSDKVLGTLSGEMPAWGQGGTSSKNWMNGDLGLGDRETYIQNRYGDSGLADIARALGGR